MQLYGRLDSIIPELFIYLCHLSAIVSGGQLVIADMPRSPSVSVGAVAAASVEFSSSDSTTIGSSKLMEPPSPAESRDSFMS